MLADKIVLKFKRPGKEPPMSKGVDDAEPASMDSKEPDEGEGYTRADLGKALRMAIEDRNDEAIYEAAKKLMDCQPAD